MVAIRHFDATLEDVSALQNEVREANNRISTLTTMIEDVQRERDAAKQQAARFKARAADATQRAENAQSGGIDKDHESAKAALAAAVRLVEAGYTDNQGDPIKIDKAFEKCLALIAPASGDLA